MERHLPPFLEDWFGIIVPALQVFIILLTAWVVQRLIRRIALRLTARYNLPPELGVALRRGPAFIIWAATLLLVLERLGVSGTVLWTAFTGFAAVGAVAFFAAWSVLSNIFCTLLIMITSPFRLHDYIELIEASDKGIARGRVLDINLIYTTLQEYDESGPGPVLQIPNSLFFQKALRRWPRSHIMPPWLNQKKEEKALGDG